MAEFTAPPMTPESAYLQDKRWRDWAVRDQNNQREIAWVEEHEACRPRPSGYGVSTPNTNTVEDLIELLQVLPSKARVRGDIRVGHGSIVLKLNI